MKNKVVNYSCAHKKRSKTTKSIRLRAFKKLFNDAVGYNSKYQDQIFDFINMMMDSLGPKTAIMCREAIANHIKYYIVEMPYVAKTAVRA